MNMNESDTDTGLEENGEPAEELPEEIPEKLPRESSQESRDAVGLCKGSAPPPPH